jgi:hypothetical protein
MATETVIASSIKINEWMQMPKYLIAIAATLCVVACAPTKALSPGDKGRITEVGVTVATRFEQLTINCKGMGCAGILYGVGGDPGAAAALTNAYGKVGTGAADLISEEVMSQLKAHGVKVQAVERSPFITLPKAPDLLSQTAKFQGNTLLHLQVWDFGLSRTGSTELQPTVLIRAYLVRREGSELLYSQAYNFGAEATGLPVNLGSTDTRFASVRDAQNDPERLARGLRAAARAVVRRIVMDVSG